MDYNVISMAVCIMAGVLVAYINYLISKRILETHPEKLAFSAVIRQVVQISYLAAVYFIGARLEMNLIMLLAGAAVGMTVPMLFFTKKLVSINKQLAENRQKGEEKNG